MTQLTSVHDALNQAILKKPDPSESLQPLSIRVNPDRADIAYQICERHGVSLAAFLRECINGLIQDYMPGPKNDLT